MPFYAKLWRGAVAGAVAAFLVDLRAWRANDAAAYDWRVAVKHVAIGAAIGALTGEGIQ